MSDNYDSVKRFSYQKSIEIIYYHGGCPDGICALNIINFFLYSVRDKEDVDKIQCIPIIYPYNVTDEFYENARGKNVIMVDVSLKYDDLKRLIDVSNTFLIIDHHESALKDLEQVDNDLKIFRMDKSGAGLVWGYFFPTIEQPRLVTFIEDYDIWTFKDPDTEAFTTVFHGFKQTYDLWLEYIFNNELVDKAIEKGRVLLEYKHTLINNACDMYGRVKIHDINGKYFIIANINGTMLISPLGHAILTRLNKYTDFASVISVEDNKTRYSLRSDNDREDVSLIVEPFKGGGHRNAAGFSLNGLYSCMPYPVIDDGGLLEAMKTATIEDDFTVLTFKDYSQYDQFVMSTEFIALLKRKFNTPHLILKCNDSKALYNISK